MPQLTYENSDEIFAIIFNCLLGKRCSNPFKNHVEFGCERRFWITYAIKLEHLKFFRLDFGLEPIKTLPMHFY